MKSIEKDYVIVNHHFASMENFSYFLETSLQDSATTKASGCLPQKNDQATAVAMWIKESTGSSIVNGNHSQVHGSEPLAASSVPTILKEVQGLSILHPSIRLQLLNHYAQAIAELAQEKCDAGMLLKSFSVDLVVLAIWKRALQICNSWVPSAGDAELPESSAAIESAFVREGMNLSLSLIDKIDSIRLSSAYKWAEKAFIVAFDRAEKLSYHLRDVDGAAEMPDAMELVFQKALAVGKSGAVDEYNGEQWWC